MLRDMAPSPWQLQGERERPYSRPTICIQLIFLKQLFTEQLMSLKFKSDLKRIKMSMST